MELIVETSMQLACKHAKTSPHGTLEGSTCYPATLVENHLIQYPDTSNGTPWLDEALEQMTRGEVDLIQIMVRQP